MSRLEFTLFEATAIPFVVYCLVTGLMWWPYALFFLVYLADGIKLVYGDNENART